MPPAAAAAAPANGPRAAYSDEIKAGDPPAPEPPSRTLYHLMQLNWQRSLTRCANYTDALSLSSGE
ncbi:hypothetical protein GCM10009712_27010 [Pseudarthrobacter sulfonivorans]